MATQYSTDIPFSSSHIQQPFKLLELPPELLTALESSNPPTLQITTSPSTSSTPSHALLKFSDKNYQMRQKNTSSPIMVLSSSRTVPGQGDDVGSFIGQPAVTVVAKIEDTIELVLVEEGKEGGKEEGNRKVGKWHEKFARSRGENGKGKG